MPRADVLRRMALGEQGVRVVAGVITQEPASRTAAVGVALAARPDLTVAITDAWPRDGDYLPSSGAACVLLLSPDHDPVVLSWSPDA